MTLRAEVEDFLYLEARLLDEWRLDEWLALLTDDARYQVPSNDAPDSNPESALFLIADDIQRLRGRVERLKDPHAHAEFPKSRTRRMLSNVIAEEKGADIIALANFTVHRFRRNEHVTHFVGRYRYRLRRVDGQLRIALREAILDSQELGSLGSVSFIL